MKQHEQNNDKSPSNRTRMGGVRIIDVTELTEGNYYDVCTELYNTFSGDKIYNITLKTSYGFFNDAALIAIKDDYVQIQHSFVLQGILNVHAHRFYLNGYYQTIRAEYNL